ncbi:MAG TPA: HU family DNA-binding protein [Planctomycetota bacterium]
MNKRELIDYVSEKLETTKAGSEEIVNTVLAGVRDGLQRDDAVAVAGFGTFTSRSRAARQGRNPQTGEPLQIKESRTVSFRPAKAWKEQLNVTVPS